ncbi:MAG: hypothetical protein Unbinned2301contig1004_44 [Prokaryotic dsDNA virus sp.]|nr:MAG: hypothetical protein Unbinned2301contig1004_44 [Prokaryotic dsDNA virus sp.]
MNYRKDDMPAFPRDHRHDGHNGMTLRDWFAGQALTQSCEATRAILGRLDAQSAAERAYEIADAMLEARK